MLSRLNILLILLIIILSIYAIVSNYKLYKLHQNTLKITKQYQKNIAINRQLMTKYDQITSDFYINQYAKEKLQMHKPKAIRSMP